MEYLSQVVNALDPLLDWLQPLAMSGIFLAFIWKFIKQ